MIKIRSLWRKSKELSGAPFMVLASQIPIFFIYSTKRNSDLHTLMPIVFQLSTHLSHIFKTSASTKNTSVLNRCELIIYIPPIGGVRILSSYMLLLSSSMMPYHWPIDTSLILRPARNVVGHNSFATVIKNVNFYVCVWLLSVTVIVVVGRNSWRTEAALESRRMPWKLWVFCTFCGEIHNRQDDWRDRRDDGKGAGRESCERKNWRTWFEGTYV